jgi:hypothetical protein
MNFVNRAVGSIKKTASAARGLIVRQDNEITIDDADALQSFVVKNLDTGETSTLLHVDDITTTAVPRSTSLHNVNFQHIFNEEEHKPQKERLPIIFIHGTEKSGRSTIFQFLRLMEKSESILDDYSKIKDCIYQTIASGMFAIAKTAVKEQRSMKNLGVLQRFIIKWDALLSNEAPSVLLNMYRQDLPTMKGFLSEPLFKQMIVTANDNTQRVRMVPNLHYFCNASTVPNRVTGLERLNTDIYAHDALYISRSTYIKDIEIEFKNQKHRMIDLSGDNDQMLWDHDTHDVLLFCVSLADFHTIEQSIEKYIHLIENIECRFVIVGCQYDVLERVLTKYSLEQLKQALPEGYTGTVNAKQVTDFIVQQYIEKWRELRSGPITSVLFDIEDIGWGKHILCYEPISIQKAFYDVTFN